MARVAGSSDRNPTLSQYFSEIRKYPILTKEQEMGLGERIQMGHAQLAPASGQSSPGLTAE